MLASWTGPDNSDVKEIKGKIASKFNKNMKKKILKIQSVSLYLIRSNEESPQQEKGRSLKLLRYNEAKRENE
jgi:hypothetical protein